jgi:metallophosphoesterase (TIGR00282 family)
VGDGAATILFVGDVVGGLGRRTLLGLLPELKERFSPDFTVVNAENVAGGLGITPKIADELLEAGVDVITLGNHTYRRSEILEYLDEQERILRPVNYLRSQPGHGSCLVESASGTKLGVVNVSGNVFLRAGHPAFQHTDSAVEELTGAGADQILVDMHAEATSEKVALGWHLDGKVSAVVGTHTHVPTADARILPGGTAYISDVGMTGPRGGVIGVKKEQAIEALVTQMSVRFETSEDDPWLNAVVIGCPQRLRADSIEQVLLPAAG